MEADKMSAPELLDNMWPASFESLSQNHFVIYL